MASVSEAEIASLFINTKLTLPIRHTLLELGHPQPPTPIQTDNSTAAAFVNETIKQKYSKTIDMRFYWLQDKTQQHKIHVFWRPKILNIGDYFTKHHPPHHHKYMRPIILHTYNSPSHI